MHFVKKVNYLNDHKLKLTFENEIMKIVDLKDHLDGDVFKPLKKINYFKKVKINSDIIDPNPDWDHNKPCFVIRR